MRGTAGFGLTIDLDGFDPEDAPGIGLKCPDGLRAEPTVAGLRMLAGHPKLKAIEIVEYIPEFDQDLRTAHLVRDLVVALTVPVRATLSKASRQPPPNPPPPAGEGRNAEHFGWGLFVGPAT